MSIDAVAMIGYGFEIPQNMEEAIIYDEDDEEHVETEENKGLCISKSGNHIAHRFYGKALLNIGSSMKYVHETKNIHNLTKTDVDIQNAWTIRLEAVRDKLKLDCETAPIGWHVVPAML